MMKISGIRPWLAVIAAAIACGVLYRALPMGEYATHDWWGIGTAPDVLRDAAERWENGRAFDVMLMGGVVLGGLLTLGLCTLWLYGQQASETAHGGRLLFAIALCAGGWYLATRMNLLPLQLFFGLPAVALALAVLRPITIILIRPKTTRHHRHQRRPRGPKIRPKRAAPMPRHHKPPRARTPPPRPIRPKRKPITPKGGRELEHQLKAAERAKLKRMMGK